MEFGYKGWTVSITAKLDAPRGSSISAPGALPKDPPLHKVLYAYFNGKHGFPLRARSMAEARAEAMKLIDDRLIETFELESEEESR